MKRKEKTVIQNMKASEIGKTISDTQSKLAQWRINRYSKQSKNVREGRSMRLKIAIAKTIFHSRELIHE